MGTLRGFRAVKFDSCNNVYSSVHTIFAITLHSVSLKIKQKCDSKYLETREDIPNGGRSGGKRSNLGHGGPSSRSKENLLVQRAERSMRSSRRLERMWSLK